MALTEEETKKLLLVQGLVTLEQYAEAEKTAKHLGVTAAEVLIGRRVIAEKDLGEVIAKSIGAPYVDLTKVNIPLEVIDLIPQDMAIKRRVIPFAKEGNQVLIAMEDPTNLETIEFVAKKIDADVKAFLATSNNLKFALRLYKKGIKEFVRLLHEWTQTQTAGVNVEQLAQDVSVVRIVDTALEYAVSENASDIHLEGTPNGVLIRYRIDGILHDIIILPKSLQPAIVARIKILANLKLDETRKPQDGRFRYQTKEDDRISLRVSILPTVEGEKVVLRVLESVLKRYNLEDLGISQQGAKVVDTAIHRPHGLILVTGPTGSGKTTTLYTMLGLLNTPEVNISTVEDPVENRMPRVNQTQVNTIIGVTFAEGLRSLLRQDPNIIMVGEIRDKETGSMAINAAMTGHLVLSTLHTNDAAGAIPRLINLGVEPFLIASTLHLIIAQRLIRLVCDDCRAEYPLAEASIAMLRNHLTREGYGNDVIIKSVPQTVFKGEGCLRCDYTGYKSRSGIYELLGVDDEIRPLIIQSKTAESIKKAAIARGMKTMFYDGLLKVVQGRTTVDEILRVTVE